MWLLIACEQLWFPYYILKGIQTLPYHFELDIEIFEAFVGTIIYLETKENGKYSILHLILAVLVENNDVQKPEPKRRKVGTAISEQCVAPGIGTIEGHNVTFSINNVHNHYHSSK